MTEYKKYTKEESAALVIKAQKGCEEAKNELAEAYRGVVIDTVKKFNIHYEDFDDAISCGLVALTKAIINFDPENEKKASFQTYATRKIEGEILRYLRDNNSVYLPRKIIDDCDKIKKFVNQYIERFGCEPTPEEVMKEKGLSRKEYELAVNAKDRCLSLNTPVPFPKEGATVPVLDTISEQIDPYHSVDLSEMLKKLSDEVLTKTEQMIIHLRYNKQLTQANIADERGVKQGVISQTEKRALAKLRKNIDKQAI